MNTRDMLERAVDLLEEFESLYWAKDLLSSSELELVEKVNNLFKDYEGM